MRFRHLGSGQLIFVGWDVPARRLVVPPQLAMLPLQVEVERGAVALQDASVQFLDRDGLVAVLYKLVTGQPRAVVLARLVKAPVFRDAQRSAA